MQLMSVNIWPLDLPRIFCPPGLAVINVFIKLFLEEFQAHPLSIYGWVT